LSNALICETVYLSGILFSLQAQFDASEMITQREVVSNKVRKELISRASTFSILLDDISLVSALN